MSTDRARRHITTGDARATPQEITSAILSASFDVSNELGHGFSEKVNRSALALVLRQKRLTAVEEQILSVVFRDQIIGTFYADLVVEGVVLVELKAAAAIEPWMEAQLLNLLKAAGGGVGMLVNFGRRVDYKRRVVGDNPPRQSACAEAVTDLMAPGRLDAAITPREPRCTSICVSLCSSVADPDPCSSVAAHVDRSATTGSTLVALKAGT